MLNRVFQPTTIPDTGERISARFTFDAPQFGAKFIYRAVASDIYSLGVVMYALFTGKKPVVGVLPSAIDRKIPRRLDEIIVNCLRADPADRFISAVGALVKDAVS